MSLSVGIMHQVWGMPAEDDTAVLRQVVDDVILADDLGYDSVWLAEHHLSRSSGRFYGRLPDPEILIARLAGVTNRIVLATGIKILPLESPLHAAERILLLDVLTGGRVGFGMGHGNSNELAPFGPAVVATKRDRFQTGLRELVAYLAGVQTYHGHELVPRSGVSVGRLLWTGVRDQPSIEVGAEVGTNFIVGESEDAAAQAEQVAMYRQAGGRGEARGARLVYVAESYADAVAGAETPATAIYDGYRRQQLDGRDPASLDDLFHQVGYVVGTPEMVAAALDRYVGVTGIDALNVMPHGPGLSPDATRRCMRLFAEEVVPRLLSVRHDLAA